MGRLLSLLLCLLAGANIASAQNIYKCRGPDGLVYRDTPCPVDQQEQGVIASPKPVNWQADNRARIDSSNDWPGLTLSGTRLVLGMTDTQVLNLPSWGRPTQIVRTKAKPGWREEWLYRREGDTSRILYFENGRLAAQENAPLLPAMEAHISLEQ